MGSKLEKVIAKELVPKQSFPTWLKKSVQFEGVHGSTAYGTSNDLSDMDIYGFCVPPKDLVFPHTAGKIWGYDKIQGFEQWQQHGIKDLEHRVGKQDEYDFTIYGIIKYFKLCKDNNPNMVDSLFLPSDCILFATPLAGMVLSNRRIFLHKGSYHKFRGYLHAQMSKLSRQPTGKRKETVEKYGFDTKYAAHACRLADECEQILEFGDLDLRRSKEHQKAVRKGEIPLDDIRKWLMEKERSLDKLYETSKLPHTAPEAKIKQLLVDCLEMHFGNLSDAEIINPDKNTNIINRIKEILGD